MIPKATAARKSSENVNDEETTLRQNMRLKGRVTPQRIREARVKIKVHNPGPWGDAEMIQGSKSGT